MAAPVRTSCNASTDAAPPPVRRYERSTSNRAPSHGRRALPLAYFVTRVTPPSDLHSRVHGVSWTLRHFSPYRPATTRYLRF